MKKGQFQCRRCGHHKWETVATEKHQQTDRARSASPPWRSMSRQPARSSAASSRDHPALMRPQASRNRGSKASPSQSSESPPPSRSRRSPSRSRSRCPVVRLSPGQRVDLAVQQLAAARQTRQEQQRQARQDKKEKRHRRVQQLVEKEVAVRLEQALASRRLDDVTLGFQMAKRVQAQQASPKPLDG